MSYKNRHDNIPNDTIIITAYEILCPCGKSFIGKEPEHQIYCGLCKLKTVAPVPDQHKHAMQEQVRVMLRILKKRNLNVLCR